MTLARDGIRVDPALLTDEEVDMSVRVDSPTVDLVVAALAASSPRIWLTTFDGREWPDQAAMDAHFDDGDWNTYNANYVSDVYRDARGAYLVVDTKGARPATMAQTVARIVVEELGRAGVTEAVVTEPDIGEG